MYKIKIDFTTLDLPISNKTIYDGLDCLTTDGLICNGLD
jgi:hypothetical protein